MGTLIKDIFDPVSLNWLISNSDPQMIHQPEIGNAAKELVKTIKSLDLYPDLQQLVAKFELVREKYPKIFDHRTLYVWRMSQACYQLTSLKLPASDFLTSNILKCQFAFLNILFDDICDLIRDKNLFDKCVHVLHGQIAKNDDELVQLIAETWTTFQSNIKHTPNYILLQPFLEDAYRKWIESFEYAFSIQQDVSLREIRLEKHLDIIAHSGTLYLTGLIDLLFVPDLSLNQVTLASQVFLRTQQMGQIANWVTTWTRELAQHDFTSGVFIMGLEENWVTLDELMSSSQESAKRKLQESPVQSRLWSEWEKLRVESHEIVKKLQLPVMDGYVESFSAIMFMLVASSTLI